MKRRRFRFKWILAVTLAAQRIAGSQTATSGSEKLTLKRAVELALASNPAVRDAQEQIAAAQVRTRLSKSHYLPQITFNGIGKLGLSGATNGLGLLGLPASPFYRNLSDAANVNQNIYDFGRTGHSVDRARAEAEAAQHNLETVRIRVGLRATEAYLKVLSIQQSIKVEEQALRERQQVLRRAHVFYEAGLSSKLDVNLARVEMSHTELALTKDRNDERAERAELAAALGVVGAQEFELVEPEFKFSPPTEVGIEIDRALAARPDLKALEAEIHAQEERVEQARDNRWPALRGVFSGGYARFAQLMPDHLMVGGLGLFAPLYMGGEIKLRIEEEQRSLESLRAQYQARTFEVRSEVNRAHAELLNAMESAEASKKISDYAEEALRLARTRYEAQLASFVDLLTAEAAAESSRANYTQALYDYQIAEGRLVAAMGLQP